MDIGWCDPNVKDRTIIRFDYGTYINPQVLLVAIVFVLLGWGFVIGMMI